MTSEEGQSSRRVDVSSGQSSRPESSSSRGVEQPESSSGGEIPVAGSTGTGTDVGVRKEIRCAGSSS